MSNESITRSTTNSNNCYSFQDLSKIPLDVLTQFFSRHVTLSEALKLRQTCKSWNFVFGSDKFLDHKLKDYSFLNRNSQDDTKTAYFNDRETRENIRKGVFTIHDVVINQNKEDYLKYFKICKDGFVCSDLGHRHLYHIKGDLECKLIDCSKKFVTFTVFKDRILAVSDNKEFCEVETNGNFKHLSTIQLENFKFVNFSENFFEVFGDDLVLISYSWMIVLNESGHISAKRSLYNDQFSLNEWVCSLTNFDNKIVTGMSNGNIYIYDKSLNRIQSLNNKPLNIEWTPKEFIDRFGVSGPPDGAAIASLTILNQNLVSCSNLGIAIWNFNEGPHQFFKTTENINQLKAFGDCLFGFGMEKMFKWSVDNLHTTIQYEIPSPRSLAVSKDTLCISGYVGKDIYVKILDFNPKSIKAIKKITQCVEPLPSPADNTAPSSLSSEMVIDRPPPAKKKNLVPKSNQSFPSKLIAFLRKKL
ncbi:MAG: hypothetical protein JHC93_08660 [Parachlamydiales bacterium]|nr:hypothetical protein [Parachlamydiales bacterium]